MGFCSVCGCWVDEWDICGHCGSSGGNYEEENDDYDDESDNYISRAEYFIRQAKTCSIKGDHKTAIKFYKEVLSQCGSVTNFNVLSFIADEYEAMGDYISAEEYWNRCTAVENYDSYKYIARKGDFLYRRERYEDAVEAYEEALKLLEDLKDKNIGWFTLKHYARVTHFIIQSHKILGWNNPEEKYHGQLKHEISRFINRIGTDDEYKARNLSRAAWDIYEEDKMCDEALILIDSAIIIHPDDKYYYRKAIFINHKLEIRVIVKRIKPQDLDRINEALGMLPKDCDRSPFLKTKRDILNLLGDPVKAKICNALAYEQYDEVDIADKQLKKLKKLGTYINITGINYYQGFAPFSEGTVVDLIKEPDNPHDRNAIRVEVNGETVGYVANNKYTLIKEVKSATDIKDSNATQAEVQFILFNEWVIAKLI